MTKASNASGSSYIPRHCLSVCRNPERYWRNPIRFALRFFMLAFYCMAAIGLLAGDLCERYEQRI